MRTPQSRFSAAGFSLLEVLIALVILSVGLLGVSGLIMTSLKANDGAYLRSTANTLAYSILDRMRANRESATQGEYNIGLGQAAPVSATCLQSSNCTAAQLTALCMGSANNCTPGQMAQADLGTWEQDLASDLPSGTGSITTSLDPSGAVDVTIVIQWDPSRVTQALGKSTAAPAAVTTSFTVVTGL